MNVHSSAQHASIAPITAAAALTTINNNNKNNFQEKSPFIASPSMPARILSSPIQQQQQTVTPVTPPVVSTPITGVAGGRGRGLLTAKRPTLILNRPLQKSQTTVQQHQQQTATSSQQQRIQPQSSTPTQEQQQQQQQQQEQRIYY